MTQYSCRLRLSYNSITSFPRGLPASLERLWLDGNQIQYITQDDDSALKVLTNLEELHLQDNHIQVVFDLQLKLMQSLEWVSLENNPLVSAGCSGINFKRRCIPPDSAVTQEEEGYMFLVTCYRFWCV